MPKFSHLHVHTQYSLLDGAASIDGLFKKATKDEMPALAITDPYRDWETDRKSTRLNSSH